MPLELVSTVASIGTFVVIAATAIVAVVQLRHLRNANEIQYIQAFMDEYEGPELRSSTNGVSCSETESLSVRALCVPMRTSSAEIGRASSR